MTLLDLYKRSPIPDEDVLRNLQLFIGRVDLADLLFMVELYKLALPVHGVIAEFGVRYGRNLALMIALRSIFEPYNHTRRVIGFDSFSGFPDTGENDGGEKGGFSVPDGYQQVLEAILSAHEDEAPISGMQKFDVISGDVRKTVPEYLQKNHQTIIALAYFDLDLEEPTFKTLAAIGPYLTKGSVVAFDELGHHRWPGETKALRDALGLGNVAVRRLPFSPSTAYFVVE